MANGEFVFLGRCDRQVKVRGHRIELEEIESTLLQHESVLEAAAITFLEQEQTRICAFYKTADDRCTPADLREWLQQFIPQQAIPAQFVGLDKLPRQPSLKVDATALEQIRQETVWTETREGRLEPRRLAEIAISPCRSSRSQHLVLGPRFRTG